MLLLSFFLLLNSQNVYALEAMDPVSLCDRMIQKSDQNVCKIKAKTLKLDWYAATACNALIDDKKFLTCWKEISGAKFNPDSLSRCVENPDDKDEAIFSCIVTLKNRLPASTKSVYQSTKPAKSHKSKK